MSNEKKTEGKELAKVDPVAEPAPVRGKDEPVPAAAAIKTVEAWADELGFAPEFTPGEKPAGKPDAIVPPVHNPKFAQFQAAKFHHGWPTGMEMTRKDFEAAVKETNTLKFR